MLRFFFFFLTGGLQFILLYISETFASHCYHSQAQSLLEEVRKPLTTKGQINDYCPEEKMFGFHKPKMYRSIEGCCICRAKSSSSRFTDSKRYEKDFQSCFGLHETRSGDICNACVLLVKRWKKLPAGSKKNWNHVVDARAGPSLKTTLKPKKVKTLSGNRIKSNQISKLQKEFKRHNSDAHSTTSSASPAQSPCYSNQSDDGSDTEMASGSNRTPVFSFLDLTYWKRRYVVGSSIKAVLGKSSLTHISSSLAAAIRKQLPRSQRSRGQSLCPSPLRSDYLVKLDSYKEILLTSLQQYGPLFCYYCCCVSTTA
uniref:SIN3-HDAC complex associated factor n=2 Tax=Pongo abelii TaxID=9601 RepID=A0A8I5T4G5_PONAB